MNVRTLLLVLVLCGGLPATETAPRPSGSSYLPPVLADVPGMARKIRVIYHIPANRTPTTNYQQKFAVLCAFLTDLYRRDLLAKGLPCDGPAFEWEGGALKIRIVNGAKNANQYGGSGQSGDAWADINADVDAALGSFSSNFDLVLTENWDPVTATTYYWKGDFALGANWGADGGRGMFSAWILQDAMCATTIAGQVAKLADATPLSGRNTFTMSNAPLYEFIEDGLGAMAHELGHAFGGPHDHRNGDTCIMGNGFRNLRANYVPGVLTALTQFSDETARNLAASRYLRQAADATDTTDPGVLAQAPLRVASGTTSLTITAHAWDDRGLWSVLHYLSAGDSVIAGDAITGTAYAGTRTVQLLTAITAATTLKTTVRDRGGRIVTVEQAIAVGKGADFTLSALGGPAPFQATANATPTAALGGTVSTYAWNFGDGTSATGATPSKTWSTPGTYTVTLTVTYADASVSVGTRQVRVTTVGNAAPAISVPPASRTSADQICGPLSIAVWDDSTALGSLVLTATSSDQAVVRDADLVLGGSGGSRTLTVRPAGTGTTLITCTVADGNGNSTSGTLSCTVTAPTLPTGWRSDDIGDAAWTGSATWSAGTFTLTGGGWGLQSTADATYGDGVRFAWQTVAGDTTITARVASVTAPVSGAFAGVMLRTSLDRAGPHAAVLVEGVATNWNHAKNRTAQGGTTNFTWGTQLGAPAWLRLVRTGNNVTTSVSTNGSTWTTVGGTVTLPAAATVHVGLVTSGNNSDRSKAATAVFDNVTVSSGAAVLAWTTPPVTTNVNTAIAPAPAVTVRTAGGATVTGANARVTVALGANPGGATLSGGLSAVAIDGIATFPDLRISSGAVGYTLVATASGLPAATSVAFTVIAPNAPPTISAPPIAVPATLTLP
jgi:PKD repeat protein